MPEAHSASRSFQVKVTGPCPGGVYSGMFGRILIPLKETPVLAIPPQAVRRVGQLELVTVLANGKPVQRAIRTGRTLVLRGGAAHDCEDLGTLHEGDEEAVEVLSGLRAGERVVLPAAADAQTTEGTSP